MNASAFGLSHVAWLTYNVAREVLARLKREHLKLYGAGVANGLVRAIMVVIKMTVWTVLFGRLVGEWGSAACSLGIMIKKLVQGIKVPKKVMAPEFRATRFRFC